MDGVCGVRDAGAAERPSPSRSARPSADGADKGYCDRCPPSRLIINDFCCWIHQERSEVQPAGGGERCPFCPHVFSPCPPLQDGRVKVSFLSVFVLVNEVKMQSLRLQFLSTFTRADMSLLFPPAGLSPVPLVLLDTIRPTTPLLHLSQVGLLDFRFVANQREERENHRRRSPGLDFPSHHH